MMDADFARLVPDGAYCMSSRVRSYEAGRSGTVGVGTVLRFLEHLATAASSERGFDHTWYERAGSAWVVREMDIVLATLPGIDDELVLATWLSDWKRVQARREYAVWWPRRQHMIARASARWAYVDRARGQLARIPDELLSRFGVPGHPMGLRAQPMGADMPLRPSEPLRMVAREYEADTQQHVNNCVYADWLEEAVLRCAAGESRTEGDRRVAPRYFHIEYVHPAQPGDTVRIDTASARRSRALYSVQTITDETAGRPSVRAWSQHLFMRGRALHASQRQSNDPSVGRGIQP